MDFNIWFILLGVFAIVIVAYVVISNNLNRLVVKIDESESGIDIALNKRFDILTKMLAATKGYADHESKTLEKITKLRAPGRNDSIEKKQEFANMLNEGEKAINVVVEQYPDLKANQSFLKLKESITSVELNLQAARRIFNSNVSYYNQKIVTFPISMVAAQKKMSKKNFFEIDEKKREDVEISF